jgi:iron complex outermembrane receptor protein
MIDWVMDTSLGNEAVWQSVNHTRINATGFETSLTLDLQQLLRGHMPASTLSLSYGYIDQDKQLGAGIVSQYALEYLRHKLIASLQMHVWRQLSFRAGLRWQDRVGSYTTFTGEVLDYRPYALADARIQWSVPRYTLYLEANNLANNRSYVDFGNVPQPGRWIVAGICLRLKQ